MESPSLTGGVHVYCIPGGGFGVIPNSNLTSRLWLIVSPACTGIKAITFKMDVCNTRWTNVLKSFLFARNYRNCFYRRINAPVSRNEPIKNGHWHGDARCSWPEDNDLRPRCRHHLFLTCSYSDTIHIFHSIKHLRPVLKHS